MADGASFEFLNLESFMAELRELPQILQTRLAKGACATGASVIRQEIVRRAPVWTGRVAEGHPPPGTLKKAIYQTRLVDECTAQREVWLVGVRSGRRMRAVKRGKGTVNLDAFYARWVEYGHYTRAPKSLGATKAARRKVIATGAQLVKGSHWVMARPFFRPGFESKKGEALRAMQDYIARNLPSAVAATRYFKVISRI